MELPRLAGWCRWALSGPPSCSETDVCTNFGIGSRAGGVLGLGVQGLHRVYRV